MENLPISSLRRESYEGEMENKVQTVQESSGTTTTTTSSSCASPQTDSSSVNLSPAVESSNEKFRFKVKDRPVSTIEEALKTEKEFIEYVMALPATRMDKEIENTFQNQSKKMTTEKPTEISKKVGLDHLDNLCKLMEQLSELKDSNVKLKRKVQYLEDVKKLHQIHRNLRFSPGMSKDDMALEEVHNANEVYKCHTLATMSHIQKDPRERSKSTPLSELNYTKSKRRFPKWSKVKEALGLDRSHQLDIKETMNRDRDEDRKISRDLNVPMYTSIVEAKDVSPARSLPDRNWYMGIIHSSSEDIMGSFHENEHHTNWEQSSRPVSVCLSDPECQQEHIIRRRKSSSGTEDNKKIKGKRKNSSTPEKSSIEDPMLVKLEKDDLKKPAKTPWSRVKTIIQTRRDSLKQRQQKSQYRPGFRSVKDGSIDEHYQLDSVKNLDLLEKTNKDNSEIAMEKKRKISSQQTNGKSAHKEILLPNCPDPAGQVSTLVQKLQRNLSQDFSKKIEEWERIKSKSCTLKSDHKQSNWNRTKSKKFERVGKSTRQRVKDINWVEKELQKVDTEMQRLSKEKQKCEKRSSRLVRLKEAMLNSANKKEVLVRTSAGEFRFEGISNDFTRKLYEWETKKGVGPEFSTIALLDACLKSKPLSVERGQLKKGYSRSETSLADTSTQSPSSSPSCKHAIIPKQNRNQLSRANSEPELSIYSGQKDVADQTQSYSSADLLSSQPPLLLHQESNEDKNHQKDLNNHTDLADSENNYYILLEDNMYLLEQLRSKEEICRRLQGELQTLDDRTELMTKKHQDEMERYREKLWEIHRPGRKPRDLQSSLKLISCLKTRIEELQRCSEKLKMDRETVEDSFRYHSEQQARLADGLAEKMKELQEAGWPSVTGGNHEDRRNHRQGVITCDGELIASLNDLSTLLLQQARDVDKTLAERSRQVCHLRWELLHRDVSMMLLQTEIHRAKWQGVAAGARRARFRQKRSWSSSERLYPKEREDSEAEEWLQNKLKRLSTSTYSDWPKVDYGPSQLVGTIHELKKVLLRLSTNNTEQLSDTEHSKEVICRTESEVADSEKYDLSSAIHSRSSSFSSEISSQLCSSRPDSRLYDGGRLCGQRRNSLGNISSMSGADVSDSSSVNEVEKSAPCLLRLPWKTWRSKDNLSTSSESSAMDEDNLSAIWHHNRRYDYGAEDKHSDDDLWSRELNIQFTSLNEDDEECCSSAGKEDGNVNSKIASCSGNDLKSLTSVGTETQKKPFEKQTFKRQSSDSSNDIVVEKLIDVGSLKVRTSSFQERFNHKNLIKSDVSQQKNNTTKGKETNINIPEDQTVKQSPILHTFVKRLDLSGSSGLNTGISQLKPIESKSNDQISNISGSEAIKTSIPEVTVATQKVKLSLYDNYNQKDQNTKTSESGDLKNCLIRNGIETVQNMETASLDSKGSSESLSKQTTNFLKLRRSKDVSAVNTLCKQTLLFSLNSPVVKSADSKTPPQSPVSSPEEDSINKGKTNWLARSLFRQK